MKAIKGLSVSRMVGSIRKRSSGGSNTPTSNEAAPPLGSTAGDTPESTAHNSVKAFCEAGGHVKGDEVLFLPPIVDAAESSPAAAAECARMIRKYMSKDYHSRPSWQYNAIMLLRILTDNPGATFTRNLDQKFVDTALSLLKHVKDANVRQILMETMDDFENTRMDDQNLTLIISMWKKEKEEAIKKFGNPGRRRRDHSSQAQAFGAHNQNQFAQQRQWERQNSFPGLPPPAELAGRLEEARTSAKLLEQVVMNTAPDEILDNELIREFVDRCQSASRSIQGYMASQNPVPDNDTMESLIDTNEQLQTALNQHQRAMLNARKLLRRRDSGNSVSSHYQAPANRENQLLPRQDSALSQGSASGGLFTTSTNTAGGASGSGSGCGSGSGSGSGNGKGKAAEAPYQSPSGPPPGQAAPVAYEPPPGPPPSHAAGLASGAGAGSTPPPRQDQVWDDPFADQHEAPSGAGGASYAAQGDQRHAEEPYHPGFGGGASSNAHGKQRQLVDDDDDIYDSPKDKAPATRF